MQKFARARVNFRPLRDLNFTSKGSFSVDFITYFRVIPTKTYISKYQHCPNSFAILKTSSWRTPYLNFSLVKRCVCAHLKETFLTLSLSAARDTKTVKIINFKTRIAELSSKSDHFEIPLQVQRSVLHPDRFLTRRVTVSERGLFLLNGRDKPILAVSDTVVRSFVKCGIALPTPGQRDIKINLSGLENYTIGHSSDVEQIWFHNYDIG